MKISHFLLLTLFTLSFCQTPFDDYIQQPEPDFNYVLHSTHPLPNIGTGYILNVTSLKWLTPQEVKPSIWKHYLSIFVPNEVKFKTAFFIVGGGNKPE